MDNRNYRVWAWEWMVWKKAVLDTAEFYQTNKLAWIGNLVGIAATLYAIYVLQGIQAIYNELMLLAAGLIGFLVTAVFYVVVHRMSVPVVLYRMKEREASRFNWDFIVIEQTEIKDDQILRALGIRVKNEKVFSLGKVIAQIQYMEIDGQQYVEDRQQLQNSRGRRLGWVWNDHRSSVTEQFLPENGGEAVIDLFRIVPNHFSVFEYSEDAHDFIGRNMDVNRVVRGEILFLAGINPTPPDPDWIPVEHIYNFTIIVEPEGKPMMRLGKGRMYKPPEIER